MKCNCSGLASILRVLAAAVASAQPAGPAMDRTGRA